MVRKTAKARNLLVITTWSYQDGLIQSSSLPYLKMIHKVLPNAQLFLVTEEKSSWFLNKEEMDGVQQTLSRFNIKLLPQPYHRFGIYKLLSSTRFFLKLWKLILTRGISHIHCFCTPAGSLGYLLSVLTRRQLVVDSYEPHAEPMVENGSWSKSGIAFRILWWFEKKLTRQAVYCIAAASKMDQYAVEKWGIQPAGFSVRPTCVDLELFRYNAEAAQKRREQWGWQNKIVCVYAGKFGGIYLDKEVFSFFKAAHDFWGDTFRALLLTAHSKEEVSQYCKAIGFPEDNLKLLKANFVEMPDYLSIGDFALTPVKPVPSKRYCSPIKDGEYWAIGLPVVITKNISDDSVIIENENAGAVIESLTTAGYQAAVEKIAQLLSEDRAILRQRIRNLAVKYRNYTNAFEIYKEIYTNPTIIEC